MGVDDHTAPAPSEGRVPTELQILPSLVSGGADRVTIELAGALAAAGRRSYVASSGGPLERDLVRAGAAHVTMPLASKNSLAMRRYTTALLRLIRHLCVDIVQSPEPGPGLERVFCRASYRTPPRYDLPQRLWRGCRDQAPVQFGDGER
jgi:hypothetical protein